jgi:DNA-binding Lrp family transcriptional regulator
MTLNAIVLVDVDPPLTDSVYDSLKDLKQIKEISSVYGIHDIFLLIKVSDEKELNEFIFKTLRPTEGVRETLTLMVTRSVKKD